MTTTARFAPNLLYGALAYITKQPHAVTREQLQKHMQRSDVIASRVLAHLKSEGLIKMVFCVDAQKIRAAVYYPAKMPIVPPPGYKLSVHGNAVSKAAEKKRAVRANPVDRLDEVSAALFGAVKVAA